MPRYFQKPKGLERVNVAIRLEELGLDGFFESESWPDATPLRELSTKIKNLTGEGFAYPFVFAELKKYVCDCLLYIPCPPGLSLGRFLPSTCPEHWPVLLDQDGAVRETGVKKDQRRLEFSAWLLAWDRYALGVLQHGCDICCVVAAYARAGAAILNQLQFKTAMKHKQLVAEVACTAKDKDKSPILGVLFDEVCR